MIEQLRHPLGAAHQFDGGGQVAVFGTDARRRRFRRRGRCGRRRSRGRRARAARGRGCCRLRGGQYLLYGYRRRRWRRPAREFRRRSEITIIIK